MLNHELKCVLRDLFINKVCILCLPVFVVVFFLFSHHVSAQNHKDRTAALRTHSYYTKQYADNSVHWNIYTPEAVRKARDSGKLIFITSGFSSCYWCYVMKENVFNVPEIVDYINTHFTAFIIDRETRPDIDEALIAAAIVNRTTPAWPNNVILTPDFDPIVTFNVLKPSQVIETLRNMVSLNAEYPQLIAQRGRATRLQIERFNRPRALQSGQSRDTHKLIQDYQNYLELHYDETYGGFGFGAKFPETQDLLFLQQRSEQGAAEKRFQQTLAALVRGAMHDHVGGGFHRYTTDEAWTIPHYEKILFTQGMILNALFVQNPEERPAFYNEAIDNILSFLETQMRDPVSGGLYASIGSHVGDKEGGYYTYSRKEIDSALTEANLTRRVFDKLFLLTPVLYQPDTFTLSVRLDAPMDLNVYRYVIDAIRPLQKSEDRPNIDQKKIMAWNAIIVYALAHANGKHQVRALALAEDIQTFLFDTLWTDDGALLRYTYQGRSEGAGFFSDYVWQARALLALYRATEKPEYLERAQSLKATMQKRFQDQESGLFQDSDKSIPTILPIYSIEDRGNLPSSNGIYVHFLLDMLEIEPSASLREEIRALLERFVPYFTTNIESMGTAAFAMLRAQDWLGNDLKVKADQFSDIPLSPVDKNIGVMATDSRSKVSVNVALTDNDNIIIDFDIEDGWYINAHITELDFLIPTSIKTRPPNLIQGDNVKYPSYQTKDTPLGPMTYFKKGASVTIETDHLGEEIADMRPRIITRFQACKDNICLPPSEVMKEVSFRSSPD